MTATGEIPRLRRGVSLIVGMDDQPMLFDSDSGKYHRLGAAAAVIVGQFDGRRSLPAIIDQLPQDIDEAGAQRITRMVEVLRTNRLLEGAGAPGRDGDYTRKPVQGRHVAPPRRGKHAHAQPPRWNGGWLLPRFIIMRSYRRVVAPVVRLLHHLPVRALSILFLLASATGFAAGAMSLWLLSGGPRPGMGVVLAAVLIQLVSILGHESWHAIVAGYLGTPVRGLGVAIMFWVVPIAFVDRTDSYQVRSRWGRAMLALAGICSDGVVCGLEAAVAAASTGTVRQVALTLCAFQLTMLLTNLHPLTQSDGVAAVEALTGSVNLRGRSMLVLRSTLRREPLPPALAVRGPAVRWGYFTYGLLCVMLGIAFTCLSVLWLLLILFNATKGLLS
ncbi:PqqD family protein [Actinomyces bowdenii]|uniref:PqqD family protein n=1 Tax=Actinomyces bowdenii TaxID=131109 RepID=UPI001ABCB8FB|nr:PqqD family protein [Actinomyces bowdenii]MBO3725008.1 PqqD family protein [Actinomyces bowdenii]